MNMQIYPEPGVVVVKLPTSEYGDIPTPSKPHDSLTSGTVLGFHKDDSKEYLIGKVIFFRRYKDDARFGDNLCLIDIKDIMGYADSN